MMQPLCSAEELKIKLASEADSPALRVIDASWYMPAANRNCRAEFLAKHIYGAVFFDIDQVCDRASSLPHMLPTAEQFAEAVTMLGIDSQSEIVVYDTAGLFSSARVWWMFKLFGHDNVRVLDGGLPAWIAAGGKVADAQIESAPRASKSFKVGFNETLLADKDVLIKNAESGEYLVLDARSAGRFDGAEPEPRRGLASGHMPKSYSLPFNTLIHQGKLKSKVELLAIFANFGLTPETDDKPIITSCGSGVTAAVVTLALVQAGFAMHKLYDGAWAEWASAGDTTILVSD